jgi:hypothetical protein
LALNNNHSLTCSTPPDELLSDSLKNKIKNKNKTEKKRKYPTSEHSFVEGFITKA